jgi:hypothetical protein
MFMITDAYKGIRMSASHPIAMHASDDGPDEFVPSFTNIFR